MRIARNLTFSALAFALAVLAPVGVRAVPTGTISIDESVQGATPTVTLSPSLNGLVTVSVPTPVPGAVGQAWTLVINLTTATGSGATSNNGGNLVEPGSQSVSDALVSTTESVVGNSVAFGYTLYSDDDLGKIGGTCVTLCNTNLIEDNTFQHVTDVSSDTVAAEILLRSDPDPVPEPGTIGLILVGLVALALERRRKRGPAL